MAVTHKWLLKSQVQISIPGNEEKAIARGTVTGVDRDSIEVTCPSSDEHVQYTQGQAVIIRILIGGRALFSFRSQIQEHRLTPGDQSEVFILEALEEVEGSPEKRKAYRAEIRQGGTVQLISIKDTRLPYSVQRKIVPVVVKDLSETGVQIVTKLKLPRDLRVLLTLRPGTRNSVQVIADLVWTRAAGQAHRYGFQFVNLDIGLRLGLRELIYGRSQ